MKRDKRDRARAACTPKVILCATVNRPRAGRNRRCGILLDVVEDFGEPAVEGPLIVQHAPTLLPALLYVLMEDAGALRVDRPRSSRRPGERPVLLRGTDDVDGWVGSALPRLSGAVYSQEYPLSVWALPAGAEDEASAAIDEFDQAPGDAELLERITALGVRRLFAFPSSLSFSVPCDALDPLLERVQPLVDEGPLRVEWA